MIDDKQIAWLDEFLTSVCTGPADHAEVEGIVSSFRKLWHVAKAAEQNPYPRSPRLEEALKAVKLPGNKFPPPGSGSLGS